MLDGAFAACRVEQGWAKISPDTLDCMKTRRVRWWSVAGGVVLALTGSVWALQGAGVLGGSAMSNNALWLVIGVPVAALGVLVVWRGVVRP